MGALPGEPSLFEQARQYLKVKYQKPGNVYLGVVSRLDAFVSGVLVFARTSKAASRLSEQFRTGKVEKKYLAIVQGNPASSESGVKEDGNNLYRLESYLRKNDKLRRVESFSNPVSGAKPACLEFRILRTNGAFSLVDINLLTGRKHQIRAQFSDAGFPIFGDQKYDSPFRTQKQIALHARSLSFIHPTQKKEMTFEAAIPKQWHDFGRFSDLLEGF